MHFKSTRAGVAALEAVQIRDTVAVIVAHGEREVGRVRLRNRRPRLQQEGLVIIDAIEDVDLNLTRARVVELKAVQIRDTVAVIVAHGEREVGSVRLSYRSPRLEQERAER